MENRGLFNADLSIAEFDKLITIILKGFDARLVVDELQCGEDPYVTDDVMQIVMRLHKESKVLIHEYRYNHNYLHNYIKVA
jgi:ABC-type branched-subunit amino acid transport system ATPase component